MFDSCVSIDPFEAAGSLRVVMPTSGSRRCSLIILSNIRDIDTCSLIVCIEKSRTMTPLHGGGIARHSIVWGVSTTDRAGTRHGRADRRRIHGYESVYGKGSGGAQRGPEQSHTLQPPTGRCRASALGPARAGARSGRFDSDTRQRRSRSAEAPRRTGIRSSAQGLGPFRSSGSSLHHRPPQPPAYPGRRRSQTAEGPISSRSSICCWR